MSIANFERRARYTMGIITVLLVLGAMAVKAGWIKSAPSYERLGWYLQSEYDGFVVTSEYADEETCRKNEKSSAVCRSGMSLTEDATADALSKKTVRQ